MQIHNNIKYEYFCDIMLYGWMAVILKIKTLLENFFTLSFYLLKYSNSNVF